MPVLALAWSMGGKQIELELAHESVLEEGMRKDGEDDIKMDDTVDLN